MGKYSESQLDKRTSYDAGPIYCYFLNLIKIHPKCKFKSAFNRKKKAKLYYGLNLTKGGLFFN